MKDEDEDKQKEKIAKKLDDFKVGRFGSVKAVQNAEKVRESRILGNYNLCKGRG